MRKADNPPPSYAVVTKSGNLNFLEPSGPVQACNGTALPFIYSILVKFSSNFIKNLMLTSHSMNLSPQDICVSHGGMQRIQFLYCVVG